MRRSSTYLILIILIGVIAAIGSRYYHYVDARDFVLDASAPCDPTAHNCFVSDCDPSSDPGCDTSAYKKVELLASHAPACLEAHTCDSFSCDVHDSTCSETYCSKDTLEDGETCTAASSANSNKSL